MQGFRPVDGGHEAWAEPQERVVLAHCVLEVITLLAQPDEAPATELGAGPPGSPADASAPGASADAGWDPAAELATDADEEWPEGSFVEARGPSDDEILAALDFDPTDDARHTTFAHPALERLLPPASRTDPEAAAEFRRYTQRDLRDEKASRLMRVLQEVESPGGGDGRMRVVEGEESLWLAALTDVRLVLGTVLGLESDADADRIEALALGEGGEAGGGAGEAERLTAGLYVTLTWWQESLLLSIGE